MTDKLTKAKVYCETTRSSNDCTMEEATFALLSYQVALLERLVEIAQSNIQKLPTNAEQ
jgi:hypothetical protein